MTDFLDYVRGIKSAVPRGRAGATKAARNQGAFIFYLVLRAQLLTPHIFSYAEDKADQYQE